MRGPAARFLLPLAIDPHDLFLLGGIHELKENRERPQEPLRSIGVGKLRNTVEKRRRVSLFRRGEEPLREIEQIVALLLTQHLAQKLVEQANIVGKRPGQAKVRGVESEKRTGGGIGSIGSNI